MFTVVFLDEDRGERWRYTGINRIVYDEFGPEVFKTEVAGEDIATHQFPPRRKMWLYSDDENLGVAEGQYTFIEIKRDKA